MPHMADIYKYQVAHNLIFIAPYLEWSNVTSLLRHMHSYAHIHTQIHKHIFKTKSSRQLIASRFIKSLIPNLFWWCVTKFKKTDETPITKSTNFLNCYWRIKELTLRQTIKLWYNYHHFVWPAVCPELVPLPLYAFHWISKRINYNLSQWNSE